MKISIVGLSVLLLLSSVAYGNSIYLSRHAEKAADGSKDPVLTQQGQVRAQNLASILASAKIEHIYATDYQRTQLTAKPLADKLGLEVKSYDPNQLTVFATQLQQLKGNILVVGHSNTTPELTHLLSGQPVNSMAESEYNYLYQVVTVGTGKMLNTLNTLTSPKAE